MLPSGYFPQLPTVVTGDGFYTSGTFGSGIDGRLLNVREDRGGDFPEPVIREMPFASGDASKAFCLRHGYNVPWSYLGESLHPMSRGVV